MKIIIQDQQVTYSYDWSVTESKNYCPTAEEAVNAALDLLGSAYTREAIAEVLRKPLPAKEY